MAHKAGCACQCWRRFVSTKKKDNSSSVSCFEQQRGQLQCMVGVSSMALLLVLLLALAFALLLAVVLLLVEWQWCWHCPFCICIVIVVCVVIGVGSGVCICVCIGSGGGVVLVLALSNVRCCWGWLSLLLHVISTHTIHPVSSGLQGWTAEQPQHCYNRYRI